MSPSPRQISEANLDNRLDMVEIRLLKILRNQVRIDRYNGSEQIV